MGYNPYRKENGEFATKEEAGASVESDYSAAVASGNSLKIEEVGEFAANNFPESKAGKDYLQKKYGDVPSIVKMDARVNKTIASYKERWRDGRSLSDEQKELLKNMPTSGDGTPLPVEPDGSVVLKPGYYKMVPLENFDLYDQEDEGVDTWLASASLDAAPGMIGGAEIAGGKGYYLAAGQASHGWDGYALLEEKVYKNLKEREVLLDDDSEEVNILVQSETNLYGSMGNPRMAPPGAFTLTGERSLEEDHKDYEANLDYYEATEKLEARGSIFNNRAIDTF